MDIKDTNSKSENLYILKNDVPKTIMASGNKIAICLGNEVEIINSDGWLIKKYKSNRQSKGIVLGDSIAGIIYKNKIEIIEL